MPIINRVAALQDEVPQWRRDIHANPEVLYEVHRTAGVVVDKLQGVWLRRGGARHRQDRRGRRHQGPQSRPPAR